MTLVEFLAPLLKSGKHQDRVLAILYYCERYETITSMTVDEIRDGLKRARVTGWAKVNVADVLSKCGALADTDGLRDRARLWTLTDSGREHVRQLLGLPAADVEVEHDVGTLETLVGKITDDDVRNYLEEALKCLKVGAMRSCVVFTWTGTIRTIQTEMLTKGAAAVTAAAKRHDPRSRDIRTIDDFAYVKDSVALLAAKDLGLFDKNEKDTLEEALDLRNRCGHPGKYRPGVKKVSAFIEDITSIVFQ